MTEQPTILVAVRYPLTEESTRTLAAAEHLARDLNRPTLSVLHVNLYQNRDQTQRRELAEAISSAVTGIETSVTIRKGLLIEREILDEAIEIGADTVVVGANQRSIWQRILHRLLRNNPEIGTFLVEKTTEEIEIIEVETTTEISTAKPA